MDWNRTERPRRYVNRTCLVLAAYAVLLCCVPLVVCRADTEVTSFEPWGPVHTEIFSDQNTPEATHHKKKHHSFNRVDEDLSDTFRRWNEHKKKVRNENKKLSDDYEEAVEKRVMKDGNIINNLKYLESDKKYFDYFPIEDVELKYDPKEDDIRVVLISSDDDTKKPKKSKKFARSMKKQQRSKRDTGDERSNTKRDVDGTYETAFIQSQSGYNIPRGHTIVRRQARNFQNAVGVDYQSHAGPNDPWNNVYSRALNNYYLPIPQPVYPSSTFVKYPIPGTYYNPISPPRGYLPPRPSKPNTSSNQPTAIIDRDDFSDPDRVVWDIVDNRDESSRSPVQAGRDEQVITPSTRRPSPPLIHRPSGNRRTTTRPLSQRPTDDFAPPASNSIGSGFENTFQPSRTTSVSRQTTRATTRRPQPTPSQRENFPKNPEPSKCVWAIINCCARNNLAIRYSCFDQIGCTGAFWDYNPCADSWQSAALGEAAQFYNE